MTHTYDSEKFRQLALYIGDRCWDDPSFGKTKLAKILFFSDFVAYGTLGKPITGATYSKFPYGPFPRSLNKEVSALEDLSKAVVAKSNYFGKVQEKLIPTVEADIQCFSANEISLVEQVIEALRDHNAVGVSRISHLETAWRYVDDWAEIPYELIFVSDQPDPDADAVGQEVGRSLATLAANN